MFVARQQFVSDKGEGGRKDQVNAKGVPKTEERPLLYQNL